MAIINSSFKVFMYLILLSEIFLFTFGLFFFSLLILVQDVLSLCMICDLTESSHFLEVFL